MGSGFSKQKKQARMLQEQMSRMQDQMKSTEVQGTSGSGLVSVTLSGDYVMTKVQIKKECVDPEDIEGLEDLIKEAYNKAAKQIEAMATPDLGFGLQSLVR